MRISCPNSPKPGPKHCFCQVFCITGIYLVNILESEGGPLAAYQILPHAYQVLEYVWTELQLVGRRLLGWTRVKALKWGLHNGYSETCASAVAPPCRGMSTGTHLAVTAPLGVPRPPHVTYMSHTCHENSGHIMELLISHT